MCVDSLLVVSRTAPSHQFEQPPKYLSHQFEQQPKYGVWATNTWNIAFLKIGQPTNLSNQNVIFKNIFKFDNLSIWANNAQPFQKSHWSLKLLANAKTHKFGRLKPKAFLKSDLILKLNLNGYELNHKLFQNYVNLCWFQSWF